MPLVTGELQSRLCDIPPAIYNAARIVRIRVFSTNRPGCEAATRAPSHSERTMSLDAWRMLPPLVTRPSDKGWCSDVVVTTLFTTRTHGQSVHCYRNELRSNRSWLTHRLTIVFWSEIERRQVKRGGETGGSILWFSDLFVTNFCDDWFMSRKQVTLLDSELCNVDH